jgi:hypothetical protein
MGEITYDILIHWMPLVGFLKDKEETEAMAALNGLDVGRPNEVMAVFRCLGKSAEGNSVAYFDIFPMLQKLMANLGPLRVKKHAEALMKAVSECLSRITDFNKIFTYCLATLAGKKYTGDLPQSGAFGARMGAIWNRRVAALAMSVSSDGGQVSRLFQNCLDHPRQFGLAMDLCANYPRCLSIADRQLDTGTFVDLVKRTEAFPATG